MAEVTVQVSACRRAALEWLMQRGQLGSGAAHEQSDAGGWNRLPFDLSMLRSAADAKVGRGMRP